MFENLTLVEPFTQAMMEDIKIDYLKHRLKRVPEQILSPEAIKSLNVPSWMEELLNTLVQLREK